MIDNWNEEILQAAVASKTLAIAVYSVDGKLIYCNLAMKKLCKGKADGNFVNPTLSRLIEITTEDTFRGVITFADESNNNYSIEGTASQKNGEIFIFGEVNVAQLVKQNITMTLLNQQINNLQRQLIKEKKMLLKSNADLAELNAEKNRILGIAAHDLRNPVGATSAYADLILENIDSLSEEETIKYLNIIESNGRFALHLLDQLLDISAIESGKIELNLAVNNYKTLIYQVVESLSIFADKKNISIETDIDVDNLLFVFDELRITQVLENLISNALKYSPSETNVLITVSIDDGNVVTNVADQGQGISPEEMTKLFQPFSTTKNIATGGEKSTGLGLSIVKKIITLHHGTVDVESVVGKGSVFRFALPFKTEIY